MAETIRFVKDVEVDYWDARYNEQDTRKYRSGTTLEVAAIEVLDRNHVNLHFDNSDLAIDVPANSFVVRG